MSCPIVRQGNAGVLIFTYENRTRDSGKLRNGVHKYQEKHQAEMDSIGAFIISQTYLQDRMIVLTHLKKLNTE